MATKTETTEAAKAPTPKTVADDMAVRRIFSAERDESGAVTKTAIESAVEYLKQCATNFADFGQQTLAAPGMDSEGNFDSTIYNENMDVMVGKLTKDSTVKAIVVSPIPTIASAIESALPWVTKILHKEMSHVSVRALREAEDVTTVVDQMPLDLTGFTESGRAAGGIGATFDELYKQINAALAAKVPVWARYRLIKSEIKRAMESKGYALATYAPLEDYNGQSLFVAAINLGITAAKRKGLDPTIFERWLETRDSKQFKADKVEDNALDMDSLLGEMDDDADADDSPADADAPVTGDEVVSQPADSPTT